MLSLSNALVSLHVLADVVWVGALLAVAMVIGQSSTMSNPAEAGALARRVYLRLAAPAFVVSLGTGAARLGLAPAAYAHLPWMHTKLTFALILIVLHHLIGARAKRLAHGDASGAQTSTVYLGAAAFGCAALAVFLAIVRP